MNREEAINILKQRQCCRECVADCKCEDCDKAFEMAIETLENQKTGHWILSEEQNEADVKNDNYQYFCSVCGHGDIQSKSVKVHYCWYCGAKMEGE